MLKITGGKLNKAQKVVLYGPEGIGKSTFASQFPKPVFIDTEGSTAHLDVMRFDKPDTWTVLLEMVKLIANVDHGYQTLVIDTADWAEALAIKHICNMNGVGGIEDFGYGKGYTYLAEEFSKLLALLTKVTESGVNVLILAHAQMRKFEQPDEMGAYDRWELKLQRKTSPLLKEWADAVLFANYKTTVITDPKTKSKKATGGQRVMYTSHHPAWDAKNRWGLPEELELDAKAVLPYLLVEEAGKENVEEKEDGQDQEVSFDDDHELLTDQLRKPELDYITHRRLRDLMAINGVRPKELEEAVSLQGFFPSGTTIESYPDDFIDQVLVANWDQVFESIKQNRKENDQ